MIIIIVFVKALSHLFGVGSFVFFFFGGGKQSGHCGPTWIHDNEGSLKVYKVTWDLRLCEKWESSIIKSEVV